MESKMENPKDENQSLSAYEKASAEGLDPR